MQIDINTYNVLNSCFLRHFKCNLTEEYRLSLLKVKCKELKDIVCFQDVTKEMKKYLKRDGYKSIYNAFDETKGLLTIFDESRFKLVESHCFNPSNYIKKNPIEITIGQKLSNSITTSDTIIKKMNYNLFLEDSKTQTHFVSVLKLRSNEVQWSSGNNNNANNNEPTRKEFYIVNIHTPYIPKIFKNETPYIDELFEQVDEIINDNDEDDPLVFYCGCFGLESFSRHDLEKSIIQKYDLNDLTYGIGNTKNMVLRNGDQYLAQSEYIFSNKEINNNFVITKQFMSPETKTHSMPNAISPSGHAAITLTFNINNIDD